MIKLSVGNSMSRIEGLDIPQARKLRDMLSYTPNPGSQYFTGGIPRKISLLTKSGTFSTGLLYLVSKFLQEEKCGFSKVDERIMPKRREGLFEMSLRVTPYPEQFDAANAVSKAYRGIVVMPTGTGKSLVTALIVNKLQVFTLVVVPTLELKRQLTQSLTEIFGKDRVGGLGMPLAIENVDALDPCKPLKGYDCVIIDEFHHSGAKTYRDLNKKSWNGVFYRVGLTATPFRSQDNEKILLESVLSQVIYRLEYNDSVHKGYIVPVEAYYVELPKAEIQGNEHSWPAMYNELVVNNKYRNNVIKKLLNNIKGTNCSSALCLVKEIAHGGYLADNGAFPFANGQDQGTSQMIGQFNRSEVPILIGTTGVLGEGVDTKPCEWVVIAGLGKSKNAFMQQVGRGVRRHGNKDSCKVIIFHDKSHKWTRSHFREQCKILLEEYGVTPIKLEIDPT